MYNTMLSGSGGALTTLALAKLIGKKWSLLMTINGVLTGDEQCVTLSNNNVTGMASGCAACDRMHQWAAVVTGIGAGTVYYFTSKLVAFIRVDDPLDAVAGTLLFTCISHHSQCTSVVAFGDCSLPRY
jgi:ammonia channel protein AmtB